MPVTYEIDPKSGLIHTRCVGVVTLEEVLDHFQELADDTSLPCHVDVLLDLTEMTSLPESSDVHTAAGEVARLQLRVSWGNCAIVTNQEALYGMMRIFEALIETYFQGTQSFRDRETAEAWLSKRRTRPIA